MMHDARDERILMQRFVSDLLIEGWWPLLITPIIDGFELKAVQEWVHPMIAWSSMGQPHDATEEDVFAAMSIAACKQGNSVSSASLIRLDTSVVNICVMCGELLLHNDRNIACSNCMKEMGFVRFRRGLCDGCTNDDCEQHGPWRKCWFITEEEPANVCAGTLVSKLACTSWAHLRG